MRIIALFTLGIVASCSAPGDQVTPIELVTLGTLEQPIKAADGHGLAGAVGPSAPRCYLPTWEGGECWLPEETGWLVSYHDPVSGEAPSDPAWWKEELKDAIGELEDWVEDNFAQWNVQVQADNSDPLFYNLRVRCGEPGGSALGSIAPTASCPTNCSSGPMGTLKKFHRATILIDCKDLEANANFAAQTHPRRARYAKNVTKHEIFHAFGLGHVVGVPGQLMNTTPDNGTLSSSTWYSQTKFPSLQEQDFLDAFQGDGD